MLKIIIACKFFQVLNIYYHTKHWILGSTQIRLIQRFISFYGIQSYERDLKKKLCIFTLDVVSFLYLVKCYRLVWLYWLLCIRSIECSCQDVTFANRTVFLTFQNNLNLNKKSVQAYGWFHPGRRVTAKKCAYFLPRQNSNLNKDKYWRVTANLKVSIKGQQGSS